MDASVRLRADAARVRLEPDTTSYTNVIQSACGPSAVDASDCIASRRNPDMVSL